MLKLRIAGLQIARPLLEPQPLRNRAIGAMCWSSQSVWRTLGGFPTQRNNSSNPRSIGVAPPTQ